MGKNIAYRASNKNSTTMNLNQDLKRKKKPCPSAQNITKS